MQYLNGLIGFLDSRSFSSVWFWLLLAGLWSAAGRSVLGVPGDVLMRARAAQSDQPGGAAAITLLNWLSLTLPRWHLGRREGAIFLGATAFVLTSLAILGFRYRLEMAQAICLMLVPIWLLFWMRVRLARRLLPLMQAGQEGSRPVAEIAAQTIRAMTIHRRLVTVLSMLSVAVAALWGALWVAIHPYGV